MKNLDETKHYLLEKINRDELVVKKHKKVCTTPNYIEHFLIEGSKITGCVSIFAFASSVGIPIGIKKSIIELKICVIAVAIKKCKSRIYKKKKNHNEKVVLAKSELNSIEVFIPTALIDSLFSHEPFVFKNNFLKEYNGMKEEIKKLKT